MNYQCSAIVKQMFQGGIQRTNKMPIKQYHVILMLLLTRGAIFSRPLSKYLSSGIDIALQRDLCRELSYCRFISDLIQSVDDSGRSGPKPGSERWFMQIFGGRRRCDDRPTSDAVQILDSSMTPWGYQWWVGYDVMVTDLREIRDHFEYNLIN